MLRTHKYSADAMVSGDVNRSLSLMGVVDTDGELYIFKNKLSTENRSKYVSSMSLDEGALNVCFFGDTEILSGHSNGSVTKTDLAFYTQKEYVFHNSSVKCVRQKTKDTFFSGDRDGRVVGWDTRRDTQICTLAGDSTCNRRASTSVTSIEFNCLCDHLVYTSESPGGVVCCWDLRYTERGRIRGLRHDVDNKLVLDMKHDASGLFALTEMGEILELSDLGVVRRRGASPAGHASLVGTLATFTDINLLVSAAGTRLTLVCLDTKETAEFDIRSANGIFCFPRGYFVTYGSDGHVTEYSLCGV